MAGPSADRADAEPAMGAALRLHAQLLRRQPLFLRLHHLRALAAAWDRALAELQTATETGRRLRERALLLRADPVLLQQQLTAQVALDLAALSRAAREPLDEAALSPAAHKSPTLEAAARALSDTLLAELETVCAALHGRISAQRALPVREEWRAWDALREQYEAAARLGGQRVRRLSWPTLHRAVCALAVWLWNERSEYDLAQSLFRHLLQEATTLDDEERAALQRRNLACRH